MTELTSNDLLPIGQIAQRAGIAVSAVRYYESQGLLPVVRSSGNTRLFPRHVLRRVAVIQASVRFGMSLAQVRDLFDGLPDDRSPDDEDWQRVTRLWSAHLERQQEILLRMQQQIAGCIGCGCLSQSVCAVANSDDSLSEGGSGPRRMVTSNIDPGRTASPASGMVDT